MKYVSYAATAPSAPPVRVEAERNPDGSWHVIYADGSELDLTHDQFVTRGFIPVAENE